MSVRVSDRTVDSEKQHFYSHHLNLKTHGTLVCGITASVTCICYWIFLNPGCRQDDIFIFRYCGDRWIRWVKNVRYRYWMNKWLGNPWMNRCPWPFWRVILPFAFMIQRIRWDVSTVANSVISTNLSIPKLLYSHEYIVNADAVVSHNLLLMPLSETRTRSYLALS